MSRTGSPAAPLGSPPSGPDLDLRRNHFLRELPGEWQARWASELRPAWASVAQPLFSRGDRMRHVYFPLDAVVAVVSTMADDSSSLLAIIGSDGVIGMSSLMSGQAQVGEALVQREGWVLQLEAAHLRRAFHESQEVRVLAMRWLQATQIHIGQTALCNRHHQAQQQICTILLRVLDRSADCEVQVTHDQLARLTGLRRETISAAAARLQQAGVLSYRRGRVFVTDRKALEAAACACYGIVETAYRRVYFSGSDPASGRPR